MKLPFLLLILSLGLLFSINSAAQKTQVKIEKDSSVQKERDTTGCCSMDTTHYGPVTIIKKEQDGKKATTKILWGSLDITKKKEPKDISLHWFGLDFGWNNFIDRSNYGSAEVNNFVPIQPEAASDLFSLRTGKSVNVNIWPITANVNFVKQYLSLQTGFGIEMNNYRYSKPITYITGPSKTYIIRDSVSFKKDKLFTEYLTIPLMLHLETNPYNKGGSFRVSIGPTFGMLVKSRTKQVSKKRGKVKNNDPFNLEKFRTGMRAELGFGLITLYGAYSFTPIHQYGLKQYPFSIGLMLLR